MSAALLGLPYELREQIYECLFQREQALSRAKDDPFYFKPSKGSKFHERPRAYLLPTTDAEGFRLFTKQAIGEVNRQLRNEINFFLRTAPVDVVTDVERLQYGHVINFLQALPAPKLRDFTVRPDLSSDDARQLRIHLSAHYDTCSLLDLSAWLDTTAALFSRDEELSTAISLASPRWTSGLEVESSLVDLLPNLYHQWKSYPSGPAREELCKLMVTYWIRLRIDCLRITGHIPSSQIDRLGRLESLNGDYGVWISRWLMGPTKKV